MKLKNLKIFINFSFILFLLAGASYENVSQKDYDFIKKNTLPFNSVYKSAESIFSNDKIIRSLEYRDLDALKKFGFKLYSTWGNIVMEHPKLNGWIIKTGSRFGNNCNNILRIVKANNLRKHIEANYYKDLVVPKHYLFHIPGKDFALDNKNYLIFCEKMDLSDKNLGCLSNKQVNEICLVIRQTGMCDSRGENIRILRNGKVAFIDTEPFLELNTMWWQVLEKCGLRVVKGAVGAHIFRQAVSKDRRINRREMIAKNTDKIEFTNSTKGLRLSLVDSTQ